MAYYTTVFFIYSTYYYTSIYVLLYYRITLLYLLLYYSIYMSSLSCAGREQFVPENVIKEFQEMMGACHGMTAFVRLPQNQGRCLGEQGEPRG